MITGVVLCGGNSTRMGSDKGLLQQASQTWAQIAFDKLYALDIPVVVSINHTQFETYRIIFSEELLITDNDAYDINGPLKGILSVHKQHPKSDLLVLAVDMVNMNEDLLHQLYLYSIQISTETIVFKHEHQIEPLCGIYRAKALDKIVELYEKGELKKHSLHFTLEQLQTVYIDVSTQQKNKFANFNSKSDLQNLH
ncbi:MAG TPA: molybdenum cofactor guanylyltransferase [Parafilimonas sp.]|nr:molybdenum cofactor guanylyltransferase [Parafilimonas sp.]